MNTDQRFDRQFLEQTCGSFSKILDERWRRMWDAYYADDSLEKLLTSGKPIKFVDAW